MEKIDVAIVGAGVVGLAILSEAAKENREVYAFEKNSTFGQETSSRNSEVIHAGIYYPKSFLKTKLCQEGKRLIYQLSPNVVFHKRVGKLIVAASEDETKGLEKLYKEALEKGVSDLKILEKEEIKKLEPEVEAVAAIFSPSTGIVSAHQLMSYFIHSAKEKAGIEPVIYETEVVGIEKVKEGFKITLKEKGKTTYSILARVAVNSAGLYADEIAKMAGIDIDRWGYRQFFCKGEYFRLNLRHRGRIKRLIYPLPERKSLGIHVTVDEKGEIKLGPNAFYLKERIIDYNVSEIHKKEFYQASRNILPFIKEEDLSKDQAGIRPKLSREDEPEKDFIIQEESSKGLPGLINLLGIESPGLTASLAIGKLVSKKVDEILKN